MSRTSYIRGFCKAASAAGVNPKELLKYAQDNTKGVLQQKLIDLERYAEDHPVAGPALIGALSPVASGAQIGGSVGGSAGSIVAAPVASVVAPIAGSAASSSGGDFSEGSRAGFGGSMVAGTLAGRIPGALIGSLPGLALSPLGLLAGLSVGGSRASSLDPVVDRLQAQDPYELRTTVGGMPVDEWKSM